MHIWLGTKHDTAGEPLMSWTLRVRVPVAVEGHPWHSITPGFELPALQPGLNPHHPTVAVLILEHFVIGQGFFHTHQGHLEGTCVVAQVLAVLRREHEDDFGLAFAGI